MNKEELRQKLSEGYEELLSAIEKKSEEMNIFEGIVDLQFVSTCTDETETTVKTINVELAPFAGNIFGIEETMYTEKEYDDKNCIYSNQEEVII